MDHPQHKQLPPLPDSPGVSYIMPVLNEAACLAQAVNTVLAQDYAGAQELVLALGPSRDGSNEIARQLQKADPRIVLVANPERDIPHGLNHAIAVCRHEVIIRVDAHCELDDNYTRQAINVLRKTAAANVGGVMLAAGEHPVQQAIARGYNSPFGLGGASYHGAAVAGEAESAYLGVFRAAVLQEVGGYDPDILRGEDWELNLRIRRAGFLVWFDPTLRVIYRPRNTFRALAQQFFATGTWRAVLVRRYGSANPWRFFMPGLLVLALAIGVVALLLQICGAPGAWWWAALWGPGAAYLAIVAYAALHIPQQRGLRSRCLTAITLLTMHLSWGAGFLRGIIFGGGKIFGSGRVLDRSRV